VHNGRVLDHVPQLAAKQPGLAVQIGALVSNSIREVTNQIEPYTNWWNEQNQNALGRPGPLVVVVGDSTAIGIGASHPANGYVGRLMAALGRNHRSDGPWRAINLAQSGAKFDDGIQRQLPVAGRLPTPDILICCLGTNDLVWGLNTKSLRDSARSLVAGLGVLFSPDDTTTRVIACPVAGRSGRARLVNRAMRAAAEDTGGAFVDPWGEPGPGPATRLAGDRFHPNDLGYELMAKPIGRYLGVEVGGAEWDTIDRSREWPIEPRK